MCQDNLFDASGFCLCFFLHPNFLFVGSCCLKGDSNGACKCPDLGKQRLPSCGIGTVRGAPTASMSSCSADAAVATSGSSPVGAYLIHGSS